MNWDMGDLAEVARTFTYEWAEHHRGSFETETLFGRTEDQDWALFLKGTGATAATLQHSVVLDAGCGSGRWTRLIAQRGAATVIGLDINEAVDQAAHFCRDLENVDFVQGNILAVPFVEKGFDLVWSNGVIHHTPDAAACHSSLARHVKPGGILYVWVYAKRFSPFAVVRAALDRLHLTKLPEPWLLRISKVLSYLSLVLLGAYKLLRRIPGLRPHGLRAQDMVRSRGVRELYLTWFDVISPRFRSTHSEEEVIEWFQRAGYERIVAIDEPKVGVRGVAPSVS